MARELDNQSMEPLSVEVTTPAFEAYSRFREDYENTAGCAIRGSMSDRETGRIGTLADTTVDKMAVVWLAEKYKDLGRSITREDIAGGATSKFDSLMAESALKQFETIKHAKSDREGGFIGIGSREKDELSSKDIDQTLKKMENQRRSLDLVNPLFANNGELFSKLAEEHDGKIGITYWDLKDARKADDRARAKGDKVYSDEERQAIDALYKKWGSSDMRRVEHRGQEDTMGCDGLLTYDTVARGAGFDNPEDLHAAANARSGYLKEAVAEKCKGEESNLNVLREARRMNQENLRAIEEAAHHTVERGEGFDRIARGVLRRESGKTPSEPDVVDFSSDIAKLNGFDRDTYDPKVRSLHPGQRIQVRDHMWQASRQLESYEKVQQYLDQNLNAQAMDQQLRGR